MAHPPGGRRPGAGRPKGAVNKKTKEIKELALQHSDKALQKIVDLIDCDDPKVAFSASQEILNRAYGKPKQDMSLEVEAGESLAGLMRNARAGRVNG